MNQNINDLNSIGNILYNNDNNFNDKITLIELNSVFNLKKAKLTHKGWSQSKIFLSNENKNAIYIEELDKWYFNRNIFEGEDIEVELYDSVEDIMIDSNDLLVIDSNDLLVIDSNDLLVIDSNDLPEKLLFSEYILYIIINYNYIICKGYKSRLMLEKENFMDNNTHIAEVYKHEEYEKIYYIKGINKWYYNYKDYYRNFIEVKLYNLIEDIPLDYLIDNERFKIKQDNNDDKKFKKADINRLNVNKIHKDLSKLGYILFEFTSINHIKYQIFKTSEEAEELLTYNNQITKCYYKRNNENIIYIKSLNQWINKEETIAKLYASDIDIPFKTKQKNIQTVPYVNQLKIIVNNRQLVPSGWIYYEIIDENIIKARHYYSSNKLLLRTNNGGEDSQYYKSKIKNVCYIQKINKWYYYNEKIEKQDCILKIYEEKEIFN